MFEDLQMVVVYKEKVRKIRSSAFNFKKTNFWTCAKMPENRVSGEKNEFQGEKIEFLDFQQNRVSPKTHKK